MQNLINKINTTTDAFIEQRKNLVMVLSCTDNESGMVMKVIQDMEKANTSDVYIFFADDFIDPESYANATIEHLAMQHQIANQEAEKESLDTLSPIPQDITDARLPPLQRLGRGMIYTRSLVPEIGVHNIIWVLYPQNIYDRRSWHELIASFSPKNGIQDGMQGLRIIFRDLPGTLEFSPHLSKLPRIQFNQIDMSPPAIDSSLDETIQDESLPDDQRFAAMLQRGMIYSAHGQTDKAYEYFKYILGYYQQTGNHALQAVTINAVGDIYRRKGDFERAIHVYESAVDSSVASNSATVLHSTAFNLAESEFGRGNFPLAEQYYGQVAQLSEKMLYADGKISALNRQAECAGKQDAWGRAIAHWEEAAAFCRAGDYPDDLIVELKFLTSHHQHVEQNRLREYRQELQALQGGD